MKYFKKITSFEDLKKQYRNLLKENHPDNGGDLEIMKEINVEFDAAFSIWKNRKEVETGETVNETASETRNQFYTEFGWEGSRYFNDYVVEKWQDTMFDFLNGIIEQNIDIPMVAAKSTNGKSTRKTKTA